MIRLTECVEYLAATPTFLQDTSLCTDMAERGRKKNYSSSPEGTGRQKPREHQLTQTLPSNKVVQTKGCAVIGNFIS